MTLKSAIGLGFRVEDSYNPIMDRQNQTERKCQMIWKLGMGEM